MKCPHDKVWLVGMSDGIHCRRCGAKFTDFAAVLADRQQRPETDKEKKGRRPREGSK